MTTPTGFIQASDVNVELGRAWNAPFNLNDSAVRNLAGKPSGAISFADLRGKSNIIREPPSGDYYTAGNTEWYEYGMSGATTVRWFGATPVNNELIPGTSVVRGSWTYYRGTKRGTAAGGYDDRYSIYRMGRY